MNAFETILKNANSFNSKWYIPPSGTDVIVRTIKKQTVSSRQSHGRLMRVNLDFNTMRLEECNHA